MKKNKSMSHEVKVKEDIPSLSPRFKDLQNSFASISELLKAIITRLEPVLKKDDTDARCREGRVARTSAPIDQSFQNLLVTADIIEEALYDIKERLVL